MVEEADEAQHEGTARHRLLRPAVRSHDADALGFESRSRSAHGTVALLSLMIVATIISMIRHRRFEPFGQDAAFHEIGRWLGH